MLTSLWLLVTLVTVLALAYVRVFRPARAAERGAA